MSGVKYYVGEYFRMNGLFNCLHGAISQCKPLSFPWAHMFYILMVSHSKPKFKMISIVKNMNQKL